MRNSRPDITPNPVVRDICDLPPSVRLIDSRDGSNEVYERQRVWTIREDSGLDLILVTPSSASIPVAVYRLVEYSKFLFDKKKAEKEQKKSQRANERSLKEMQFRQQISENDYSHKLNQVIEWLPKHDVFIELKLDRKSRPGLPRGVPLRQLANWNEFVLNRVCRDLRDKATIEQPQIGERIIKIKIRSL